jgi:hypothetical protein
LKLKTLIDIYNSLNNSQFANVLTRPVILGKRWRNAHGQYVVRNNAPNRMEFNPAGIKGIAHARSVVYHEMVHQYIEEFLENEDCDLHHGPEFWKAYRRFAPSDVELGECL